MMNIKSQGMYPLEPPLSTQLFPSFPWSLNGALVHTLDHPIQTPPCQGCRLGQAEDYGLPVLGIAGISSVQTPAELTCFTYPVDER